jgi:hypothetical protein
MLLWRQQLQPNPVSPSQLDAGAVRLASLSSSTTSPSSTSLTSQTGTLTIAQNLNVTTVSTAPPVAAAVGSAVTLQSFGIAAQQIVAVISHSVPAAIPLPPPVPPLPTSSSTSLSISAIDNYEMMANHLAPEFLHGRQPAEWLNAVEHWDIYRLLLWIRGRKVRQLSSL